MCNLKPVCQTVLSCWPVTNQFSINFTIPSQCTTALLYQKNNYYLKVGHHTQSIDFENKELVWGNDKIYGLGFCFIGHIRFLYFTLLYYNQEITTYDLPMLEVKIYKTKKYYDYVADMEGPPHPLQMLWEKVPVSGKQKYLKALIAPQWWQESSSSSSSSSCSSPPCPPPQGLGGGTEVLCPQVDHTPAWNQIITLSKKPKNTARNHFVIINLFLRS